jgi:hypothetical protein
VTVIALGITSGCGSGGGGEAPTAGLPPGASAPVPAPVPAPGEPVGSGSGNAPVITLAVDDTVRVGADFELMPDTEDADGDRLTFSAENLPPWATIDTVSGTIRGTPQLGDVGVHEDIRIVVADGTHSVSTTPFSITVLPQPTGTAALAWSTPAARVDGSALDDLAGYRIAYGRDPQDLDRSLVIEDAASTSYTFTALDEGVWYFSIIAVTAGGLEGPPTQPVMKSI